MLLAKIVQGGVETLSARAGFTPAPTSVTVGLAGERVQLDTQAPTLLDLELRQGSRTITAVVDKVPSRLVVNRTESGDSQTFAIEASARIASVVVSLTEPGSRARLALTDVPTAITATVSPERLRVDAAWADRPHRGRPLRRRHTGHPRRPGLRPGEQRRRHPPASSASPWPRPRSGAGRCAPC